MRSSGVSSGQPSVENGQRPDENHVSSTSGSWRTAAALRARGEVSCARRAWSRPCRSTTPGIRWPHQSWREMHQSLDVLHPVVVGLRPLRGTIVIRPSSHRLDRRLGQRLHLHVPLLRDERLHHRLAAIADADRVAVGLDLLDSPSACMSSTMRLRASKRSSPAYLPAVRRHLAVEADDGADRQVVALARSRSRSESWPGVTLMTPVPNSGSTASSATTCT